MPHSKSPSRPILILCVLLLSSLSLAASHPRLFFDASEVQALRDRQFTEPYASMLQKVIDGGEAVSDLQNSSTGAYNTAYNYAYQTRNYAFAYLITQNPLYAQKAKEKLDLMRNEELPTSTSEAWYTWTDRQLALTQGSLAAAMAYDFCYDAWDPVYRAEISLELYNQAENQMNTSGPGWNGAKDSNWWAIRYSGAGIAYLASDEPGAAARLTDVRTQMAQYFSACFSTSTLSRGAIAEGMGYTMYPWGLIAPYLLAELEVNGYDYRTTYPGVAEMGVWPWFFAVPIQWWTGYAYSTGLHPAWSNDHNRIGNSGGPLALTFPLASERYQPGLKWFYDRFWGAQGDQTYSFLRSGSIWAYIYYPDDVVAENPTRLWGNHYFDAFDGMIMFRNEFYDELDIVAGVRCRSQDIDGRIHNGPDMNSMRLWGLGNPWIIGSGGNNRIDAQSTVMKSNALSANGGSHRGKRITPGQVLGTFLVEGGSGWSVTEAGYGQTSTNPSKTTPLDQQVEDHVRRLLIDYDNPATAVSALVMVSDTSIDGELWRINTPEFNTIQLLSNGFIITDDAGNALHGFVHHPANPTITSGYFDTGDKLRFGDPADYPSGQSGYNNRFIDVQAAGNTDFQITLLLVPAGQTVPAVTETGGSGAFRTIQVGGRNYTPAAGGYIVPDWNVDPSWTVEQAYAAYVAHHGLSDLIHSSNDDDDTLTNYMEFVMGTDPKDPNDPGSKFMTREPGGMRLSFFKARPEVPIRLQSSTDLNGWSTSTDMPQNLPVDSQTGSGSFFLPVPETPGTEFFRLTTGD